VFTTAYDEYALQAFRENAVDYIEKPIDPEELDAGRGEIAAPGRMIPSWRPSAARRRAGAAQRPSFPLSTRVAVPSRDGLDAAAA
jgi:DNA-binding LytR/AlgR family response regulator